MVASATTEPAWGGTSDPLGPTQTGDSKKGRLMPTVQTTKHAIAISAPPDVIYALLANAAAWPLVFDPSINVDRAGEAGGAERLRLWAMSHGTVREWTSRRELFPDEKRITFTRTVSPPPTASMSGEWIIEPTGPGATVCLLHNFSAVDDSADSIAWITEATERNSRSELAGLKAAAEGYAERGDTVFGFVDELVVDAEPTDIYDFLYRADLWPQRIPHVGRLELTEDVPNIQHLEMDTRSVDGSSHTTTSIRICQPPDTIIYKQIKPPRLMSAHTGRWTIEKVADGGARVSSRHDVVIDMAAARSILGDDVTASQVRERLRTSLGTNSLATLRRAQEFVAGQAT